MPMIGKETSPRRITTEATPVGIFARKASPQRTPTKEQEVEFQRLCRGICAAYPYANQISRPELEVALPILGIVTNHKRTRELVNSILDALQISADSKGVDSMPIGVHIFEVALTWFWLENCLPDEQQRKNVVACYCYHLTETEFTGQRVPPSIFRIIQETQAAVWDAAVAFSKDNAGAMRFGKILASLVGDACDPLSLSFWATHHYVDMGKVVRMHVKGILG